MLPRDVRCKSCGAALTVHESFAQGVCGRWRCRPRHLDHDLRAHRDEAARAVGEPAPERFPFAVVPYRAPAALVPIPREPRDALEQHLRERMAEVAAEPYPPRAAVALAGPRDRELYARVCGACGGACCADGLASFAFFDDETLRRLSEGRSTSVVVDELLAWLPALHIEGSCLYHTTGGCGLPRDLRSGTCNRYECRGLIDARERFTAGHGPDGFVVIRYNNRIIRSAFVGSDGARTYSPPAPG